MPPTGGARAKARSAGWSEATQFSVQALRTRFSRQGVEQQRHRSAVRGRAAWPRLRRHLADKIGLPLPKTIGEPHSGRQAATLRRASGAKARSAAWSEATLSCPRAASRG